MSQGSTAFAEELEAQDLVFRTDRGRITEILSHPDEPPHVLNIKRGILSALQVQFVDEHATLEEVSSCQKSEPICTALINSTTGKYSSVALNLNGHTSGFHPQAQKLEPSCTA